MSARKRPVYLVVRVMGKTPEGEELYVILDIKLTSAAADKVVDGHPGSKVVKRNLV